MGMSQTTPILAIDISKDRLDCFAADSAEAFAIDNDATGRAALVRRCRAGGHLVALEASGGYEKPLLKALCKADIPVRLLDPRRVRHFARACGQWAKTDPLDARAIAAFAAAVPGPLHRPDAQAEALGELVTYRRQLVEAMTTLSNQAEHLASAELHRDAARRIAAMKLRLAGLDRRIVCAIEACPELRRKAEIIRSIPGAGPVLAATILAELPEAGTLSRRAIAALVGVAPCDNKSGRRTRPASIRGGRPAIRPVLYMAAQIAARHNPHLADLKARIRAKSGKPKVAIVAVMRKLIVLANALLRDNRIYAPA